MVAAPTGIFGMRQTEPSASRLMMASVFPCCSLRSRLTPAQPVTLESASPLLYTFLKTNNIKATHFMIGENILTAPTQFLTAFSDLQSQYHAHLIAPVLIIPQTILPSTHGLTGICRPLPMNSLLPTLAGAYRLSTTLRAVACQLSGAHRTAMPTIVSAPLRRKSSG